MLSTVALHEIRGFLPVSDSLATAGQPTEDQLREIADSGFEVVINLGLLDPKYCLKDEAGTVRELGLEYHHVPVNFQQPTLENFQQFERAFAASEGKKAFVHCAANMRVSCFIALYGERHFGWSRERADAHVRQIWEPDETWQRLMAEVRDRVRPKIG